MNNNNPITSLLDTKILDMLRKEIDTALAAIADKHGLESIKLGKIKYSEGEFSGPITAKVKAEFNEQVQREQALYSEAMGYSKNIVGLTFVNKGVEYKVTGINFKKPKFPIECVEVKSGRGVGFANHARLPFADKTLQWERPVTSF